MLRNTTPANPNNYCPTFLDSGQTYTNPKAYGGGVVAVASESLNPDLALAACQQDTRVCGGTNRWEFTDSSTTKKIINVPCTGSDDNSCTPSGTGLTAYNKCSYIISVSNPGQVTEAPGFSIATTGSALTSVDLFYVEMTDPSYLVGGSYPPSRFPDPAA